METPWPVPPSSPNRVNGKRRRSSVSGDSFERHAKHSCHPPPVSPSLFYESMGEDVESPEPRIQSPVARHQSLGFKDWQVSERESSLPLAREGRTSAGEEAGQPSPIGDQDETSDGREDRASLTPTLVDPPLQTSNVAPLRCTPTVACQWGLIVASFNRSISDRLGDVQMTEMMLQRAVTTHQYPVGPMPEAKLNLYIVSAQMKVAVSCDCNMTSFHEDCYEGVNSTSIQAKATFSFEYHSCNGVYQENFIRSSQHGLTVNVEPVDQVLDLGDLHWRDDWQVTLRALTRDQVKHHAKEACRSFNECMAHWLAARLFEASNQGEGYTCHENYDDFFIAEDDLIRNICWMV